MPRITLWGFYQYDKTLFDNIVLPDGIEKENLVAEIMKNSGDLYPYHQVPEYLKRNINYWFARRLFDFGRIYEALRMEYSPIENYDRYEDIEDNGSTSGTSNSNSESNAYEFPMESPLKKQTAASDGKGTANSSATAQNTRKAHIHGNIGVTTSQQMLESEINLQKQLSMLKQLYIKAYDDLFFINF